MKLITIISIAVILTSCHKYDAAPKKIDDDFALTVSDTTGVRADAASLITVTLSDTLEVRDGLTVTFSSTKGSFLFNDVVFKNHLAKTNLKVDQDTGTYVVKALLKEGDQTKIEKLITFSFRRAHPDTIGLELDRSLYNLSNPIIIKTFLFRNVGLVTKGTPIFFRAYQLGVTVNDTVNAGRFEGVFSNYSTADGKLSDIKLYTDTPGIDTTKIITIQAKALKDNGDTLRKSISIRYH